MDSSAPSLIPYRLLLLLLSKNGEGFDFLYEHLETPELDCGFPTLAWDVWQLP